MGTDSKDAIDVALVEFSPVWEEREFGHILSRPSLFPNSRRINREKKVILQKEKECDFFMEKPINLQELSPEEKLIVKSADKLCAYIKCIEEKRAGNGEFDMAYESTAEAVKAYREKLPEVDYFCSNYLGGFYLPLDTLKRVE